MAERQLLSIVTPVFNEAEAIPVFLHALDATIGGLPDLDWEVVFVNDGSIDGTLTALEREAARRANVVIVDLSRNFGKEAALTAGLDFTRGDAVVPMDVDLQDPPELIERMLALWREGWEVVVARRQDRSADSAAKRITARGFYRLMSHISRPALPPDVGDFRLMDRKVVEAIRRLPEKRRFMKGLFAWVGFRTTEVSYERPARAAGHTKFNSWKLWNLALEGITSFSTLPLRIWTYFGAAIASIAFLYGALIIGRTILRGIDVPGYASLVVLILFFGGIHLVTLGVIGEYLGRTYEEAKQRPVYVVRECIRSTVSAAAHRTARRDSEERLDLALRIEPSRMPAIAPLTIQAVAIAENES